MKRIFDFTASLLLILLLLPVFLLIGIIVLIDSGFPVIFKQYRVGKDNKLFYIYKFSEKEFKVATTGYPAIYANDVVAFAKREHAQAAIKMLGDELKYLFEPW